MIRLNILLGEEKMGKQIDMYNTFFGDCFIIQNEDSNLMVDFGTHSKTLIPRLYHYTYGY